MKRSEHRVDAIDGTRLLVERFAPDGDVKRVVVFVHGGSEQVGRYERVCAELGDGTFGFGPDHRGQGKSGGPKGHVDRFEDFALDLRTVIERTRDDLPAALQPDKVPWFFFAHSMGGLIALVYLLDHGKAVPLRGAAISSPLLGLTMKVNPIKRLVGELAGRVLPKVALPTGLPPEAISRDPEEVRKYIADPRRVDVVSAGFFLAMKRAIARVQAEVASITVPLHWYVGTADRICDPEQSRRTFAEIPDPSAYRHEFVEYEGYYHELHNEAPALRKPVLDAVLEFYRRRAEEQ